MNGKSITSVGQAGLSMSANNSINVTLNQNTSSFSANLDRNRNLNIYSTINTLYGKFYTSIGGNKPILIFKPDLGETDLEFSLPSDDFFALDVKFTHPLKIKNFPVKIHAEYQKKKPLMSIEADKNFSYKSLSGNFWIKYGKSIDMLLNLSVPYFNSSFSIDSSNIKILTNFGIPRFFISHVINNDYNINSHVLGAFAQYQKSKFSIEKFINNSDDQNIITRAECELIPKVLLAGSVVQNKNKDLSYALAAVFDSKYNVKILAPKLEVFCRVRNSFKKLNFDTTVGFDVKSKDVSFGVNLVINE
ncbi:hypothetical protein TRFO_03578 [Tritrichomonas foetus]|uniref:Uncharacterized protein n=1 Tax=Tritrichomonas foetus TaxID=1144522 RepID=A0A1J4KSW5_9EUKA|nr:hypothetical protein TRFO_03578 [Tritrichomonas foetus]|eukprot:OHT12573.1 hypothetical protein TRFO_03578 [Tritrichomonas foetus]